ncbi:MAG TPA: hypothetical protein VFX98_03855, partial [Longimicrobiaceae bacterium]|nr:hypothetical protein [Longimicrobiaceae bacterium]
LDGARGAAPGRDWSTALSRLERATDRWQPSAEQRLELGRARFDVQLEWAGYELEEGRFRSAYRRAESALGILGRGSPEAGRALDVQEEALRRGTVRVAALPVISTEAVRPRLPAGLLDELNDELALTRWAREPLFVEIVDPQATAREFRREGLHRRGVSTRDAALLGQRLGAGIVVVAEVDTVRADTAERRATRRPARTRAGVDTAYTVEEGRRELWVNVNLAVVEVDTRRVLETDRVSGQASRRFRRGGFAGDWRTLSLSREERDLFDEDAAEDDEHELVRELVVGLSDRLARAVYDRALRYVD